MVDHDLTAALRLLLDAMDTEDEARRTCESAGGMTLFVSLGTLNEATAMRQGYARAVRRLMDRAPAQRAAALKDGV